MWKVINKGIFLLSLVLVNNIEGSSYTCTYVVYNKWSFSASVYKNLKYFEIIHADDLSHNIAKRGTGESSHPYNHIKEVSFKTHGQDFRLILSPKTDILHSNFKAYAIAADGKETSVHIGKWLIKRHIQFTNELFI